MSNDHDLIRKFQNGDKNAFNEIVRKHLPNVIGFFINITQNEIVAEDLTQDVFYKLYKHLKKFRFESEFTTYLYRINVNTANNWITRNKWKNLLHLDQIPEPRDFDKKIDKEWKKEELWIAVKKLPKKQRTVVILRIVNKLSYKEISRVIQISENTAKVNFHYALQKLKKWISDVEKKLIILGKIEIYEADSEKFLKKFHHFRKGKEKSNYQIKSAMIASIFIFLIGFFTAGHLSDQSEYITYIDEYENNIGLFDMGLWNLKIEILLTNELVSVDDIALFLLQENDFWTTMDIISDTYWID